MGLQPGNAGYSVNDGLLPVGYMGRPAARPALHVAGGGMGGGYAAQMRRAGESWAEAMAGLAGEGEVDNVTVEAAPAGEPAYPPTLEDLRAEFLAARPGYSFHVSVGNPAIPLGPGETAGWLRGGVTVTQQQQLSQQRKQRIDEWRKFVGNKITELTGEALEILEYPDGKKYVSATPWTRAAPGVRYVDCMRPATEEEKRHMRVQMMGGGWVGGQISDEQLLRYSESEYNSVIRHPLITPEARAAREEQRATLRQKEAHAQAAREYKRVTELRQAAQQRAVRIEKQRAATAAAARVEAERLRVAATLEARRIEVRALAEEIVAERQHAAHMARVAKISALAVRESLTQQEAEAVLAHLSPAGGFQKDTLLAFQVINRYARANGIQNSDAEVVLREYL